MFTTERFLQLKYQKSNHSFKFSLVNYLTFNQYLDLITWIRRPDRMIFPRISSSDCSYFNGDLLSITECSLSWGGGQAIEKKPAKIYQFITSNYRQKWVPN